MASLEEQVAAYQEIICRMDELEEKKRELNLAIMQQMTDKSMKIAGCIVRRCERLSYRTSLDQARELNATKMEEVLNKKALKKLYLSGAPVPGVIPLSFIQVIRQKQQDTTSNE